MSSSNWVPPVDIYQNGDHELVLKAELPDMSREDIDITVDNGRSRSPARRSLPAT
jgi:HSP20 family molecular chaperone IbpA